MSDQPIPVPHRALSLIMQAAWGRAGDLSSAQRKALDSTEDRIDDYAVDSPMNQGHGKTVDDYESVSPEFTAHLFRVTDGEQVAYVRTCDAEKAKRDSRLSGKLKAHEVPAHSDPARSE